MGGLPETGFFLRVRRCREKPGFFDCSTEPRNRVFAIDFITAKIRKKHRILYGDAPDTFQRLWRVDRQQFQQKESWGLGLAIAEAIVQQHQGKIQVSSKEGVGSCFQVHLPLASNLDRT